MYVHPSQFGAMFAKNLLQKINTTSISSNWLTKSTYM
jgi:hypothetical protein